MFYLKASEAKANALAAFEEGRLQCQQPEASSQGCRYSGPCGIGVSIPAELAETFDALTESSIDALIDDGLIDTDDRETLSTLQILHDGAMSGFCDEVEELKELEAFLRG